MLALPAIFRASDPDTLRTVRDFESSTNADSEISNRVRGILEEVRSRGNAAIFEYTRRFDKVDLDESSFRVTDEELEQGLASLQSGEVEAILRAKSQIEAFHRRTVPENWEHENGDGAMVGERFYPIQSVGLYVPGGNVPLVSSVLMTAVLASLARNPRVAVVTPPLPDGKLAPGMLAALHICGLKEVYKVGGAQAIGMLAFGTETVSRVDKVFGPGNAYVLEAKRQVFGTVGVDLLPGPSEVAIVADMGAQPAWVAADLIAQAEHGSGKERVLLLGPEPFFFEQVWVEVARQLPNRNHNEAVGKVLSERCLCIAYKTMQEAAELLNAFAPEHLELQVDDEALEYFSRYVTTAGAMLLGYHTPTVLGDFTAGPSHTLPTGGAGRYMSGLQLSDFIRRTSVVHYDHSSLRNAFPVIKAFSFMEQLDGHGFSAQIRLEGKNIAGGQ